MRGLTYGSYVEALYEMPSPGTALASSTTRTLLSKTAAATDSQPFPLLASFWELAKLGQSFWVEASGYYGTTGSPTLIVAAALDTTQGTYGTTLAATGAYTAETGAAAGSVEFVLGFKCTVNALGTSGTLAVSGFYVHGAAGNAATAAGGLLMVGSSTAIAINTEVTNYLEIWGTWGASSSSNSVQLTQFMISGLN